MLCSATLLRSRRSSSSATLRRSRLLTPLTDAFLVVDLGLGSCATLVPLASALDATGLEEFALPSPALARGYALVAILMAMYQACLLAAIALTSPTFVAMGTMLAVPGSIAMDFVLRGSLVPVLGVGGILLILAAFGCLIFAAKIDERLGVAVRNSCGPASAGKRGAKGEILL